LGDPQESPSPALETVKYTRCGSARASESAILTRFLARGWPILAFCAARVPLDSFWAGRSRVVPRLVWGSGVLLRYRPSIASPASG